MYTIAIVIIIVILSEFYYYISNSKINFIGEFLITKKENETIFPIKYNKYSINGDKIIKHEAGYIFLKENYNLFIKENNKTFLAKKDKIYKINSDFVVEVLDINGKNIIYYYINSNHNNLP
jgi:hypothetical protein